MTEPIFHLALAEEWRAALAAGSYEISTRGRTLAEEGFIHAARADQWETVRALFYADVASGLLLLEIDPSLLSSELRIEHVAEAGAEFPHIYGPLNPDAVVRVLPLTRSADE